MSLCLVFSSAMGASERSRPNIIIVDADDLGRQLGCYGDKAARTPNLDRLAADGVRFDRSAVAQPSCSPSRSALYTGLQPHRNGTLGLAHHGFSLAAGIEPFPAILKEAGYRTASIGKVHVAPITAFKYDSSVGGMESADRKKWPEKTRDVRRVAEAIRTFIGKPDAAPFLISLSFLDPHEDLLDQYLGLPENPMTKDQAPSFSWSNGAKPEKIAAYYNSISRMDAGIGMLREVLRETGHDKNTLIVFWGDNGPPFPGAKGTLSFDGVMTPLIIAGPGVKPGQVRGELVSMVDVFPTVLEAAGLGRPLPAESDARSLWPLLRGEGELVWRTTLCTAMTFHGTGSFTPMRQITDGRWWLLRNLSVGEWFREGKRLSSPPEVELYDLQVDPAQRRNLAGDPALQSVLASLDTQLEAWRKQTGDQILDPGTLSQWAAVARDNSQAYRTYSPPKKAQPKRAAE